jgi:hypothetical protein
MARKTLIFGNGLGMALNPEFFSIDYAIGRVWQSEKVLDETSKALVRQCLVQDGNADRPHGEADLDSLHLVVSACDLLERTSGQGPHWLSEHGRQFPIAVRRFIYKTALHFHQRDFGLPVEFSAPLAEFVHETNSHIATLNYDNLLYQSMIEARVLDGYNGALVDGLLAAGFKETNLERKFGKTFGFYMHLHGSPLFVDREEKTIKLNQGDLDEDDDVIGSHVVLTHVKHKAAVISASSLLSSYWEHLSMALSESDGAVLFGYSGFDDHLNELLRSRAPRRIRVVEWEGAGAERDRHDFWGHLLGQDVELNRLGNVLEFKAWKA